MKGRAITYSAAELIWLEANRTLPIQDYARAFCKQFDREVAAENLHALRKRKGWKTGRTGHFAKGQASHNKGKRCAPGTGGRHPNAVKTQFRKGAIPHTYRGPGHECIDKKDGYVIMIVAEPNPWTGAATRPVHKHRYLWEQANGPVPAGMCLKSRDGNKANTDPTNWELVPRAILPRLNGRFGRGYDTAPAELKPTILAAAKVEHAIRVRKSRKVPA